MLRYVFQRLFYALITVWIIATMTFFLMKILPGDLFFDPKIRPEVRAVLMSKYALDRPLHTQYTIFMKNILKGDLGTSIRSPGRSVNQFIREGFPKSFAIGWRAMLFADSIGILFGLIAGLYHNKIYDYAVIVIAIIGVSVPTIVMGPLLAYIFGVNLGWLPVAYDKTQLSLLLPSFTLGLGTLAFISRMMRTTTLEVLNQDYINTARAKGLSPIQIIRRHVIRNAIMPVITILGPLFAAIITGSIVIEQVFAVNGIGGLFVNTILNRDYPMVMGITIFYAVLIVFAMLLVDIAYGLIDPRLRIQTAQGD